MPDPIDILGLGAVAVDDLLFVDRYPPPDAKTPVLRRERHCGGLTATALVAAQRLGARCAYAGVLGRDAVSQFAIDTLAAEGLDLSRLRQTETARPINATIIVDQTQQTRNIFVDFNGVVGAAPDWPPEDVIQSCRVLMVDPLGVPGMLRAAAIARAARIPVVADLEATVPESIRLLDVADHLVLSWEYAAGLTYAASPDKAALALWRADRQAVVVTCGEQGAWYVGAHDPGQPIHQPAFPVAVVDTTGCGDVFHGAYAAALARGSGLAERVRFASAAAALKATRAGGQAGAPRLADVELFLKEHPA